MHIAASPLYLAPPLPTRTSEHVFAKHRKSAIELSYREARVARNQSKTIRGISQNKHGVLVLIVNRLYNQADHRECHRFSHQSIGHLLLLTHATMFGPYRKKRYEFPGVALLSKILLSVAV